MEYTAKQLEKMLLDNGWYLVDQKGSHRHYKHNTISGKISIPFHKPDKLKMGTANNILKAAGLKEVK